MYIFYVYALYAIEFQSINTTMLHLCWWTIREYFCCTNGCTNDTRNSQSTVKLARNSSWNMHFSLRHSDKIPTFEEWRLSLFERHFFLEFFSPFSKQRKRDHIRKRVHLVGQKYILYIIFRRNLNPAGSLANFKIHTILCGSYSQVWVYIFFFFFFWINSYWKLQNSMKI